ncbi:G protein-coupled glucose receptor regulating Gpa2-domain-containing protein [Delphinella strobiligena]|nr:G protein-coupled glucose receptor regulating Gpa2-domain-containing protein [Delphinella strobiligena]
MGLGGHLQNPSGIFTSHQSRIIQTLALIFATISVLACAITAYWFLMMKRNFRRQLIGLLICGDFFKSAWFLVFAATALAKHGIATDSKFCQANGFLLQAALECCDVAILFMSVHMSLQIFYPTSKVFGHDGLYRFRHTVLCLFLMLPLISASLAFVNTRHGYISQGPFCTLPLRPYWYRLALTWIPRYIIWFYIMFVALRIYLQVGRGFTVFARQEGKGSTEERGSGPKIESRRGSRVTFVPDGLGPTMLVHPPLDQKPSTGSLCTMSSSKSNGNSNGDSSIGGTRPPTLEPIEEGHADNPEQGYNLMSGDTPLKKRRRAIQRQLRLLFIYPMVYMIMWAIPFVYHSMNYSDHYAQHPIFALGMLNIICQCGLGFVDSTVFSWREKPWQHIPGSDGTFFGSFMFWRFDREHSVERSTTPAPSKIPATGQASNQERRKTWVNSVSHSSMKSGMHRKTFSGSSDRSAMDAERAAERLALERADRENRSAPPTRRGSIITNSKAPMEWWEREIALEEGEDGLE